MTLQTSCEYAPPKGRLVYGKRNPCVVLCGATVGHIEWQGLNRGIAI